MENTHPDNKPVTEQEAMKQINELAAQLGYRLDVSKTILIVAAKLYSQELIKDISNSIEANIVLKKL